MFNCEDFSEGKAEIKVENIYLFNNQRNERFVFKSRRCNWHNNSE